MAVVPASLFLDLEGPVHVADFGGPEGAPVVVCVHGLAGSHVGWGPFARELTTSHRVLAVDLPGHGRTPALGRSPAVPDNSRLLAQVLAAISPDPVLLVGHSMGAAVAALTARRHPDLVAGLTLFAPPLPRHGVDLVNATLLPHVALCLCPPLGRRALRRRLERLGPEAYVRAGLALTCSSPEAVAALVPALTAELSAACARGDDPIESFIRAARSVGALVGGGRSYRRALVEVEVPTRVVHGAVDRLLPASELSWLRALRPDWSIDVLEAVGHSPHMEAPARAAAAVRGSGTETRHRTRGTTVRLRSAGRSRGSDRGSRQLDLDPQAAGG
jgi:pimeloyl-ACP methyl ester carboxylesterase